MKGGKGSRLESLRQKMINVDSLDTRLIPEHQLVKTSRRASSQRWAGKLHGAAVNCYLKSLSTLSEEEYKFRCTWKYADDPNTQQTYM